MTRKSILFSILILVLGFGQLVATSQAGDPEEPFCYNSARTAFFACTFDIQDDFWESRTACINLATGADRADCRDAAVEDRIEARGECQDQREAREELCDIVGGGRYTPDFDPANFEDPDSITNPNPFWSLTAGKTSVIASDEEIVITYVTDEIKMIDGVPCRVVVDAAVEEGVDDEEPGTVEYAPVEVTDDWYAQHVNGDVWYCGELSRDYDDDGDILELSGSFQAGVDGALPGVLIPANPVVGLIHRQEWAVNEAEDVAEVLSLAGGPEEEVEGFECNGGCLQTRDFTPLEPGVHEHKFYIAGLGFVLAIGFEDDIEDGREEIVCTGSSLDILADPACGIADPVELLDQLCELHSEFCPDDEEPTR